MLRRRLPAFAVACLMMACLESAHAEAGPVSRWCAPELEAVTDTVCFVRPESEAPRYGQGKTLIIFLHSLLGDGSQWQWEQQRLMARLARSYGVSALMPRGRPGLGPGRDPNVIAWPTAQKLQEEHEDALIAEWLAAKAAIEKQHGAFDRVLVFGFSNGAYYAASLALRGRLSVDGYAAFAGGAGGKYARHLGERAERRVPLFVGYGTKDPDHTRQQSLVRSLRDLKWPHASKADRIGHTVSDSQVRAALSFLIGPASEPSAPAGPGR